MAIMTVGIALLMVQTEPPAVPPAAIAGPTLGAPRTLSASGCRPAGRDGDILICGKTDPEQYRLRPLGPPPNGEPLSPMTARVGNGTVDAQAIVRTLPGAKGPALMVTLKLPF